MLQVLDYTAPQLGGDVSAWAMSLRNAHERFVQVRAGAAGGSC